MRLEASRMGADWTTFHEYLRAMADRYDENVILPKLKIASRVEAEKLNKQIDVLDFFMNITFEAQERGVGQKFTDDVIKLAKKYNIKSGRL